VKEPTATVVEKKVESAPVQEVSKVERTGEAIFNKCKTCHGNNAEKQALGASQIIKGWDVAKIEQALQGYKNGTYGAKMKNTMAPQVKDLSDEEITKVATYIHSL
jgi:cytochrome c553